MSKAAALAGSHRLIDALLSSVPQDERPAYLILIGRAALVRLAVEAGNEAAAEKAYQWADEIATRR